MPDKNFIYTDLYLLIFHARIQFWEYFVLPIFVLLIYFIAKRTQRLKIEAFPEYKYYVNAILFKILGVFGFCMIYTYYYDGGDTFVYFVNANALSSMAFDNPLTCLSIFFGDMSSENQTIFSQYTRWLFYWRDPQAFFVNKLVAPATLLGLKGYLLTSVVVASITFSGVWKMYRVFYDHFPKLHKELAIAILFMPSVVFWGSGILKDSFTLASAGWITYSFYHLAIKLSRKKIFYHLLTAFISAYILISLKPYILYSLLFGFLIWYIFYKIQSVKSNFHRILIFPSIFMVAWVAGGLILGATGKIIGGDYENIDKMINRADVIRRDLIRSEQYGSNNFNIGDYDKNSLTSVMMKIPQAMAAGLFRPYLWDVRNIVMLLSGLENMFLIIFTLMIVFRTSPMFLLNALFDNPLILFSFVFAMVFAFSIGFSTSNFGALVRYKIPLIPFYMAALFFVRNKQMEAEKEKREKMGVPGVE